ncbi:MAG: tetratricopeptide repeat protein [Gemmatimonadaceae bacterium]|nr:tetratricopeptide repeat protein [Gemmatimonadaceae bacterium]
MRRLAVLVPFLLALAACPREQAPVEELYTTRMLGLGYLERNQLAEAESAFRKLTKLAPDDPLGYTNLGLTYLQWARYDDAEKQLERARKIDPAGTESGLALAKVYALTKRPKEARDVLEKMRSEGTRDTHVLFALAELDSLQGDSTTARSYMDRLRDILAIAPANLVARLKLAGALERRGEADSVVRHLEEVRRIPPEPPKEARIALDSTIQLLRAGKIDESRKTFDRLADLMKGTAPYQASLAEVRWAEGPIAGEPVLTFAPKDFISLHGSRQQAKADLVRFVDATDEAGLARATAPGPDTMKAIALAVGDVDGDGTEDIFISRAPVGGKPAAQLFREQGGFARDATERSGIALPQGARAAIFADYDNDGWLDLFAIGGEGRGHLFHNRGDGTFEETTAKAGVGDVHGAEKALFVDVDHDGDLDLLLLGEQRTVYRNNLDGTFGDATAAYGLAGTGGSAAFGDFDGDGRTDLVVGSARGGTTLLLNHGAARFTSTALAGDLAGSVESGVVASTDYDNDGFLDILVAGANGGEPTLWRNEGDGTFARDTRSSGALQALRGVEARGAAFVDYDNDGWVDLAVAGTAKAAGGPAIFLFRNDGTGRFVDRSTIVPQAARAAGATALAITDVDGDGDEDILLVDASGAARLLRNDHGNDNLGVNVALKALRTGSGKNNTFGIGSRLELRAGDIYQTRTAAAPRTHFGLGPHLKADVLRVEWPNGVPQTVYLPGTDQDVVEREMLKGSCGFVYTWDGTRFRFVTDAMWRSALGMPLGLMGSTSAFAPAGASQEYVRIPGDALVPRDGRYTLQLTEELWETAYADQVKLLAVDHPDSIDVFVDERFVPPGPVSLRLYQIARRRLPLSAVDDHGNDVLDALRASDDVYVSNLVPTTYQGVVERHDLVLDLGPDAGAPGTQLFLRGWIYPTDASINVALGQQSAIAPAPPSVEVRDAKGVWHVVIPSIGFPSGKDKTMVIDLAGKFLSADHHVRLRTTMQIYWDQAFVAREIAKGPARVTTLEPQAADLHYRGFSRMYRKGGRYGPYWFDYGEVTKDSPWRPITGDFTRFGDVRSLLGGSDDMYVIMAPGDEATIHFDASSADSIPRGWKRDFLLYTDGWIKDSDLNTAFGTTVGPLPFHAVKSYPYAPGEAFPADPAHERWQREFNTRRVGEKVSRRR